MTVFGASLSPYTQAVKYILDRNMIPYRDIHMMSGEEVHQELKHTIAKLCGKDSLPAVFVGYNYLGGLDELKELHEHGDLESLMKEIRKLA